MLPNGDHRHLLAYILDPLVVRMEARGIHAPPPRDHSAGHHHHHARRLFLTVPLIKEQMIQMSSGENSSKTTSLWRNCKRWCAVNWAGSATATST
jgi:hypothetical protein